MKRLSTGSFKEEQKLPMLEKGKKENMRKNNVWEKENVQQEMSVKSISLNP
jgi:hypothetical protein